MNLFRVVSALLLGVACASSAFARTIIYDSKPINVEIRYDKATVFRFEAKVSSVQNAEKFEVAPLNDQSPNYAEMSLKPRTTSAAETVNFHLVDGGIVMLRLVTVSGQKAEAVETFHTVKKKEKAPAPELEEVLGAVEGEATSEGKVALMKALILGSKIRGYQIKQIDRPLKTGLLGVEAVLLRVYAGKELNGYVFKLVNKASQSKYEIDIRRLKIGEPNLALMTQVDRKVIEPESSGKNIAYLTIVALPSSLSRDVVLPVAWVKKGG